MQFAKWVFYAAGISGIVMIVPPFFLEAQTGQDLPPPITHPEFYYGFLGVTLAWQFLFLVIGWRPARYRLAMLPAMLEKAGFAICHSDPVLVGPSSCRLDRSCIDRCRLAGAVHGGLCQDIGNFQRRQAILATSCKTRAKPRQWRHSGAPLSESVDMVQDGPLAAIRSLHMAMNEWMLLGLGGLGSGMDISALIAFLAFAAVYFLAPIVGYEPYRPTGLTLALYAMIVYAGTALIQLVVQWLMMMDGPRPALGGGPFRNELAIHFSLLFGFIKVLLFLIAMIAFVIGLRNLRLRHYGPED